MNFLVPDSWLREYLETRASPREIARSLSLSGPSVEKVKKMEDDFVYELEITTNRVDLASILGIAGEAAAILPRFNFSAQLQRKDFPAKQEKIFSPSHSFPLVVQLENKILCPRFTAVVLENIVIKPSPDFIQKRLILCGLRPINNVVDISNYLMKLFGQPVHTFDYEKIGQRKMILRESRKGEKITTLDGKTFTLPGGDIVIEDGFGRLIDLCGIMGGENSAVDHKTKKVLLFVQNYSPRHIRRTSMLLGQRTEAATLFEKGLDPENVLPTIFFGIELLEKWAGGKVASQLFDFYPNPYRPKFVQTTTAFINQRLGISLETKEIKKILFSLGFTVKGEKGELVIGIPSRRAKDVCLPEDIVEEVARIYGYHNLPSQIPKGKIPLFPKPPIFSLEEKIRQALKFWGYTETYHYSFLSKNLLQKAGLSPQNHLRLANPLTEETVYLRRSLLPSFLETTAKNQNFSPSLSFFEIAKIYRPGKKSGEVGEILSLAFLNQEDFFTLKGIAEALIWELGTDPVDWKIPQSPTDYLDSFFQFWHPKQVVSLEKEGEIFGTLGQIHPETLARFQIKKVVYAALFNLEAWAKFPSQVKKYQPISPYPALIEDYTFSFPSETYLGPIIAEIKKIDKRIKNIAIKDRFRNFLTFTFTYQDEKRNLESASLKSLRQKIFKFLKNRGFSLKGKI